MVKSKKRKKYFSSVSEELEAYYKDVKSSVIVQPNLIFNDSLILYDNEFKVRLFFLGEGHTQGDIVAMVPQDKLLVTGDLVHDYEPLFWDGHPDSWIQALEKIKQLDFDYFVGGHGDMHIGKEIINSWLNYIRELKEKTIVAIREGLSMEAFLDKATPETFTSLQNGYGQRIQKFRTSYINYFTGPLLDAVRAELMDIWKFYDPLLKKN